jgi:serine/threonine protein kinase
LKIVEESQDPLTLLILEAERRGAELQRQLHDCDSRVVEIYEFGSLDGYFLVAMQYIEGRTIAEILREERRIEPSRAALFTLDILSQLDKLHSFSAEIDGQRRSVVHGDIKPSNIQIGSADEVRLLDFGIAKALTFTHSRTHLNLGSPAYCSPERLARGQVDRHADLWAVAVTMYEMVAGTPPYQAQDTRKLEELIQARRPPRALPDACPAGLRAILQKALAGDLHQRYVSAAAFESDLRLFLQGQPTVAETERRTGWRSNPTVEKARLRLPERISLMTETVKRSVMRLKPPPERRLAFALSVLVALSWGLLTGLVIFVPVGFYYRYQRESAPLVENADYTRAPLARIDSDWNTLQRIQRRNAFLGRLSPADRLSRDMRAKFLQTSDEIIDRYRNSSDPLLTDFDWAKAADCLEHAAALSPGDASLRAKLALAKGNVNLVRASSENGTRSADLVDQARREFEDSAATLTHWPDPHLGLARIYAYSLQNVGKMIAELHEAQRLGFDPGPREMEEQADGYRIRAALELNLARKYRNASKTSEEHYLQLAQRDLDRARQLYEPIEGFSHVSLAMRQVDNDDRTRAELEEALKAPPKHQRKTTWRASRWQ